MDAVLYALLKNKIAAATSGVSMVNGKTGAVTVVKSDIDLDNVTNDAQVKRSEMGAANGVATLDLSGKVYMAQIPIGIVTIVMVQNEAARLALPQSTNLMIALQADTTTRWELNANLLPSVSSNWIPGGSYAAQVVSVNGAIGAVTINLATLGIANVKNYDQTVAENILSGTVNPARLPIVSSVQAGALPALPGVATKLLKGDGTWGTPAGSLAGTDTMLQYNKGGTETGADSGLTWDYTNKILKVGGTIESVDEIVANTLKVNGLSAGMLKVVSGVVSQAVAGVDYQIPLSYLKASATSQTTNLAVNNIVAFDTTELKVGSKFSISGNKITIIPTGNIVRITAHVGMAGFNSGGFFYYQLYNETSSASVGRSCGADAVTATSSTFGDLNTSYSFIPTVTTVISAKIIGSSNLINLVNQWIEVQEIPLTY